MYPGLWTMLSISLSSYLVYSFSKSQRSSSIISRSWILNVYNIKQVHISFEKAANSWVYFLSSLVIWLRKYAAETGEFLSTVNLTCRSLIPNGKLINAFYLQTTRRFSTNNLIIHFLLFRGLFAEFHGNTTTSNSKSFLLQKWCLDDLHGR